jgi:hypothetical protein
MTACGGMKQALRAEFKLPFRGDPKDLAHRDLWGHLFRVGPKQKFSLDDSWIPRF